MNIKIIPSTFAEDLDKSQFASPFDYVIENSKIKALEVANQCLKVINPNNLASNIKFVFIYV
jgi:hypothetical protein